MSVISGSLGAVMGSEATTDAANTAASAQDRATDLQKNIYNKTQSEWEPYRQAGEKALNAQDKMLYGGYNMESSPSAQYALTQGTRSLNRQMSARGSLGGGSAANRLAELSSGIAASDYTTRYNQLLNAVQTGSGAVSGSGQSGIALGQQAQTGATNLGNIAQQAGQSTASLYSGLGGASANTASAALKGYDLYNKYNEGEGASSAAEYAEYL